MTSAIRVRPLKAIIGGSSPLATGAWYAGTLAPSGSYHRCAPRAIDIDRLDADQRPWLATIFAARDQAYDELRRAVLRDALIAGQGSVVTREGWLLRESALEFLANGATPEGFAPTDDGSLRLPLPCRRIAAPVLLLKRPWWRNYGHWLVDSAAMLALAARLSMPANWSIVVGRQEHPPMRQVVADTLACLAPGVPVLEHPDDEIWACDELHYIGPVHVPPLFKHKEALVALRAGLLPAAGAPPADRRLFVSRGNHGTRRLSNEADLVAQAMARGYEVVEPQLFDLAGQARLFDTAACVVGVKGAALANLLFCRPGAACLVLSPGDFPDPFFWDLAGHAGVSYAELFGGLTQHDRARSHNSFAVDPDRFARMLPD